MAIVMDNRWRDENSRYQVEVGVLDKMTTERNISAVAKRWQGLLALLLPQDDGDDKKGKRREGGKEGVKVKKLKKAGTRTEMMSFDDL
jgi:hypothetical protein